MKRIDTATAVADLHGAGKDGFTDGNPGVTPRTLVDSDWFNGLQEEVARVIESFGLTLDGDDLGQLAGAMAPRASYAARAFSPGAGIDTGTVGTVGAGVDANGRPFLIACTSGVAFYSIDAGRTWSACPNGPTGLPLARRACAYDSATGAFMVATSAGVEYTLDLGGTWTTKALAAGTAKAFHWADAYTKGAVHSDNGKIYRFTDITAGSPFTSASTTTVATDAEHNGLTYNGEADTWCLVADPSDPYYSTDGGANWTAGATGLAAARHMIDVASVPAGYDGAARFFLIIEDTSPSTLKLYTSTDGISWTDRSTELAADIGPMPTVGTTSDVLLDTWGDSGIGLLGVLGSGGAFLSFNGGGYFVDTGTGVTGTITGLAETTDRLVLADNGADLFVRLCAGK